MKDSRVGESLWDIWEGSGYNQGFADSIVYYTEGHVDVEHEIVRKALASSIQRDGITYSLFSAFGLIDTGICSQGWVGLDSTYEIYQEVCDESGQTISGSILRDVIPVTFVEVQDID
jgi:hypothetical protein